MTYDQKIAETCPARHVCKQHQKMCGTACSWFIDLRYQITLSSIPKRFTKYTVNTLPSTTALLPLIQAWSASDVERVTRGDGIYMFGNTGIGKTTVATAIALNYVVNATKRALQTGARLPQLVKYTNVPDLLTTIKNGFNDDDVAAQVADIQQQLTTVPLAIFDDIGAEKPSEFVRERLYTIINTRYDNELSTIFTSNMTVNELTETLDRRISSRIQGMTKPFPMNGTDHREWNA